MAWVIASTCASLNVLSKDEPRCPDVPKATRSAGTWHNVQTVGSEFSIQNAVFPAMVAGDDGRAAFAFIGTPKAGDYQDQTNFKDGVWHLYVTTTYDRSARAAPPAVRTGTCSTSST